ncbi:MAG: hypothetical protein A2X42_04180 [Candidatus Margulisbacteria bacterium GWF2_38_17]|nr:MAG: hypothetical protein A2X43_09280 [Candidatus Margulisbacteria bacterium GWD2_39_127]OGI05383.1 MAG: hypothetical protein A2X42_04180 [Candidatus Margulisbacteria bacterium GWF2_38_17]OGI09067.1 MAG: hypothetical protein A2X41_00885 [Candidatus Margulisbacteria bacterium GWE2_39_32]
MNDDELVESFLKGNEHAFEGLVDKYHRKIFKTVYGIIGHYHDAIDLTQDVFFQVYRSIPNYQPKGQFQSWVFKIALNRSRNYISKKKILTFLSLDFVSKTRQSALIDKTDRGDIEGYSERNEKVELLYEALNILDYNSKEILILKEIDMLEYKQIAEILGIEIGTVKSRISRAKEKLKKQLIKRGISKWM